MGTGWTVALVILTAFFVWRGAVRHRKDIATRAIQGIRPTGAALLG